MVLGIDITRKKKALENNVSKHPVWQQNNNTEPSFLSTDNQRVHILWWLIASSEELWGVETPYNSGRKIGDLWYLAKICGTLHTHHNATSNISAVFELQDILTLFEEDPSTRKVSDIQHLLSTWRSKGNIFINMAIEDGAIWKCLGSEAFSIKLAYITRTQTHQKTVDKISLHNTQTH